MARRKSATTCKLIHMTDRPVRIGLTLQPQHMDYPTIRRTASAAEDLGLDVLFTWDHFFPVSGDLDGMHFECWTTLAAWAESTSRVSIGTLVCCNSYRNPDLVADMARTVDHISGGRLVLGMGSGWFKRDYTEYGYEFGTAGSRLDDLAEALPRIESRWGKLNPPPTRKIPVLVGGSGEKKTLRMVARHADIWHSYSDASMLKHKLSVLGEHCAAIGRDPTEIEISLTGKTTDRDELYELGARLFIIYTGGPQPDLTELREFLAWRDKMNA
ncbi:LLM class F420-dependent oxidoreductase [Micromonospora eburnea]|uniref:Probable F420-dependent oxidoreductase, MSMEG_2906 family n=1 Tax=Micromonospora eburnea TaxID=227316 RepID=A0A1C6V1B2_9ACTN|nr:LLM class F420-dependent oxidoreductase [Micromonospora eburnea]SCL59790.1 probable F420-dependent oxidoreductase, MSMEG_2906 family [Micromonospora eburnea]